MKTFKEFLLEHTLTETDYDNLRKFAYDRVDNIWSYDVLVNQYKKNIDNSVDGDFPYGIRNIPNPVILYRILSGNDIREINKRNLGFHFVGDKKIFDDDFLHSISTNRNVWKQFVVTIETDSDNISLKKTLISNTDYPNEHEYRIKDDTNLKILDIEKHENI